MDEDEKEIRWIRSNVPLDNIGDALIILLSRKARDKKTAIPLKELNLTSNEFKSLAKNKRVKYTMKRLKIDKVWLTSMGFLTAAGEYTIRKKEQELAIRKNS